MNSKMPNSPNDMPFDHDKDNPNWRWNVIATLNQYSCVDIHWENDEHVTAQTGEPEGQWDVSIETRFGKRFSCKHENIENALWHVTTLAANSDSESWRKQYADRKAALEKLTPRERQVLGLAR